MRIFALTSLGEKMARSTRVPDTPAWKVIYFLDKRSQASDEQIAAGTGLDRGTAMAAIRTLKANRVVMEVGRDRLEELSSERGTG